MDRDQTKDRKLGKLWEENFAAIIIPCGFSAHNISPQGNVDSMIWDDETGNLIRVQIRHKVPWFWSDIGNSYGYEQYRLNKDLQIVTEGCIVIYAIHNYSRLGRESTVNEMGDWVAQDIEILADCVDKEALGWTYYGEDYRRLPICYWKTSRFEALENLLYQLKKRL